MINYAYLIYHNLFQENSYSYQLAITNVLVSQVELYGMEYCYHSMSVGRN